MRDKPAISVKDISDHEFFFGHKACAGCGGSLAVRLALKTLGPRVFTVVPAGCMGAVGFTYPSMPFFVNALCSLFSCTGAVLSGIGAAARKLGLEDYHVVGFAGDGGTADIGIQALSGAVDRNERIIYFCYDNEAYMNTGVQESGLTLLGARTTTSVCGAKRRNASKQKKNMFEIMAAHDICYAATASVGHPQDFIKKVAKAMEKPGTSYIHVMAPCPTGWGMPAEKMVEVTKKAVDCGLWYLAEYEGGEFTLNRNPRKFKPISEYVKGQNRFKTMTDEDLQEVTSQRDAKWEKMRANWKMG